MEDGEQEGLRIALQSDNCIIMATTLATLALAGSAFLWRSSSNKMIPTYAALQQPDAPPDPEARVMSTSDLEEHGQVDSEDALQQGPVGAYSKVGSDDPLAPEGDMKDSKSVRSKERRRRRKDPLKELLKTNRKPKGSSKTNRPAEHSDESGTTTPTTLSKPRDSIGQINSRDTSLPPSSRSVSRSASIASSAHRTPFSGSGDVDQPSPGSQGKVNIKPLTPTLPAASSSGTEAEGILGQKTTQAGDMPLFSSSTDTGTQLHDVFYEPPALSLSLSESSASSSSSLGTSSEAVLTPGTSPASSLSENTLTPTLIHPSRSLPASAPSSTVKNLSSPSTNSQNHLSPGPWDWDGAGENPMSHKPPRFRPTSRGSSTIPPPLLPPSASMPALPASASFSPRSPAAPSYSVSSTSSGELPLSFPTLNAVTTSTTSSSPSRIHSNTGLHENGFEHTNSDDPHINGATKKAITPRRTPTPLPGMSTPPPSVSAQTQIASLKGALEAARMREEKMKSEMERCSKELELLRWEGLAWRRREVEFQTHIHHLMHQLQAYAALFTAIPPLTPLNAQHHVNGNNNPGHNPSPPNPNGSQTTNGYPHPLPASQSPQTHIIPPNHTFSPNGFLSPTGMLSPASAQSGPHSPFFTYPSHLQQQTQPQAHAQPSPHQSNLFSMLFPHVPSVGTSTSSASSIAGSSAGSHSPELGDSMSPGSDRGRKRTRAVNGRTGGGTWEGEVSDGWIGVVEEDGSRAGQSETDDDDAPLNGLLADAILKRPGSIRVASKRGKVKEKETNGEEKPTEFVFPSLSDWGNVHRDGGNNGRTLEGKPLAPTGSSPLKPALSPDSDCTNDDPHAGDITPSPS